MNRLKVAGGLWIVAGLSSAATLFGVIGEFPQMPLMLGGAIVGLTIGTRLVRRPDPTVILWSTVAGVAWLVAFGALTWWEIASKMGYEGTAIWLTAWGVAGAVAALTQRDAVAPA